MLSPQVEKFACRKPSTRSNRFLLPYQPMESSVSSRASTSSRGRGQHGPRRGGSSQREGSKRPQRRAAADYTPAVEAIADQDAIAQRAKDAAEAADAAAAALNANQNDENGPGEIEEQSCYICAETIKYFMLGTCSHRTCHICSVRLRALYKKKDCTFCKVGQRSLQGGAADANGLCITA